jgi:hypothetical protein
MSIIAYIKKQLELHGSPHALTIEWKKFDEIIAEAQKIEEEAITMAYSEGWHDGQDVIIAQIKHIDKGGDALGHQFYAAL